MKTKNTMKYMIQGPCNGHDWSEEYVGNDADANTFETRKAAEKQIPCLARIFECPKSDFRVVER